MTSAIGSVGGASWTAQRLDSLSMAKSMFAKLDTKNQGYIDKAELQSAFDQISTNAASGTSSSDSSNVDALFKKLDGDSDGKITQQEMADGMQKLADELNSQFNQSRMTGMRNADQDAGFTKDELTSMVKEIGSSDSKRSELMTKIASNFDTADTNGDGKVNGAEAMSFDKASQAASTTTDTGIAVAANSGAAPAHGAPPPPASGGGTSDSSSAANAVYDAADTNKDGTVSMAELLASLQASSSADSSSGASSDKTNDSNAAVMKMVLQLMAAYGKSEPDAAQSATGSEISVVA